MDQNTTWGQVTDFSWYTNERLRSLPENHPLHSMGRMAALAFHQAGADHTLSMLLKEKGLPDVYMQFFKDCLYPQKFAKYDKDTPVQLIRYLLSKSYYAYEGVCLGGKDHILTGFDLQKLPNFYMWYGVYERLSINKLIHKLVPGTPRLEDSNDWHIYEFPEFKSRICVIHPNTYDPDMGLVITAQGNQEAALTETTLMEAALRVSIKSDYDTEMDIHDYHNRNWLDGTGRTLKEIRKRLVDMGVKSVSREAFTLANGNVISFKLEFDLKDTYHRDDNEGANKNGLGVPERSYVPRMVFETEATEEIKKMAMLAWAVGRDLK